MGKIAVTVPWADPHWWSPDHPNLYVLRTTLQTPSGPAQQSDTVDTRFGFREFWAEGQQFMLNGVPIRLRGASNFQLGRTEQAADPLHGRDSSREECLNLKDRYLGNAARMHAQIMSGNVPLGADEAGYLMVDQSSIWSVMSTMYRNGGEAFLNNTHREFTEWVRRDRNSPSVVIWDVENEQLRAGEVNKPWAMQLDDFIRESDNTRLVEHAGGGWYDKDQQIVHLHDEMQYTDIMERWRARDNHPLTIGEFWVGFRGGDFRITSSLEYQSRADYVCEEARLDEEEMLQMRYFGVSGVMPFSLPRALSPGPEDKAAACLRMIDHGLQPMTIFFWPRSISAAAGGALKKEVVVCNDSETARDLTAEWSIEGGIPGKLSFKLAPAEQRRIPVSFTTPAKDCRLVTRLLEDGKVLATEEMNIRVANAKFLAAPALKRQVVVYEGARPGTVEKLKLLGVTATAATAAPDDPNSTLWVIAPGSSDAVLNSQSRKIREYLEAGGHILCLAQEQWPRWSPIELGFSSALKSSPWYYATFDVPKASKELNYSCYAPIYAAGHPIFQGITAADLRLWSPRDGRVMDDALIRPAAKNSPGGAWRILAGGCVPEMASIAEMRVGKGTLVFCQAQVLEQSQTPEARLVLMNLLRYLDGAAWSSESGHVALAGAFTAAQASTLTGVDSGVFTGASPEQGGVLIATDGAAPEQLEKWANAGGTVLVLSGEVAKRLPGYAVTDDNNRGYSGAYGAGNPLLWGVSMASFMGGRSCVEGVLTKTPESVAVLLHGASGGASRSVGNGAGGSVAVAQSRDKGQWIVTTMAPWRGQTPHDGELMRTLLANAGVTIPAGDQKESSVQVLKTIPLKIDGRLDKWTSDMEDRNVSQYVHAKPIVFSSQDAMGGKVKTDADLSGIVYFLWNDDALYLAGVLFEREGKGAFSARINGHLLEIIPTGKDASVRLDGKPSGALKSASGRLTSDELTDTKALSLFSGSAPTTEVVEPEKLPGATFEIELPWNAIGWTKPPDQFRSLLRIERPDGGVIQSPASATANDLATWLMLTLAP
jgi:hypothetical protein